MTFYYHNLGKLSFITKVVFLGLLIVGFSLYFLPLTDRPSLAVQILVHILFAMLLAFITTGLIYLNGYVYHFLQARLFKSEILSGLFSKYGFVDDLINTNTKWKLTQQVKTGLIDTYPVVVLRSHEKAGHILVVIEIEASETAINEIMQLETLFKCMNAQVGPGAIVGSFNIHERIEDSIKQLIKTAKQNGLKAATSKGYV